MPTRNISKEIYLHKLFVKDQICGEWIKMLHLGGCFKCYILNLAAKKWTKYLYYFNHHCACPWLLLGRSASVYIYMLYEACILRIHIFMIFICQRRIICLHNNNSIQIHTSLYASQWNRIIERNIIGNGQTSLVPSIYRMLCPVAAMTTLPRLSGKRSTHDLV